MPKKKCNNKGIPTELWCDNCYNVVYTTGYNFSESHQGACTSPLPSPALHRTGAAEREVLGKRQAPSPEVFTPQQQLRDKRRFKEEDETEETTPTRKRTSISPAEGPAQRTTSPQADALGVRVTLVRPNKPESAHFTAEMTALAADWRHENAVIGSRAGSISNSLLDRLIVDQPKGKTYALPADRTSTQHDIVLDIIYQKRLKELFAKGGWVVVSWDDGKVGDMGFLVANAHVDGRTWHLGYLRLADKVRNSSLNVNLDYSKAKNHLNAK
jgi:hypothetical protein